MSYDLNFWRCEPSCTKSPQEIYELLCDDEAVNGLQPLPVQSIIGKICEAFPATVPHYFEGTCLELNWQGKDSEGAFQVTWSSQHFRVDCYGLQDQNVNKLISIASEFFCSFYDPQVERLYQPKTDGTQYLTV